MCYEVCLQYADNGHWNIPSVYLLNPTSLAKPNAIELLTADVNAYGADVVVITESWLKKRHPDSMFNIPEYNNFRRDRPKRRGGGVAIYEIFLRNSITSQMALMHLFEKN